MFTALPFVFALLASEPGAASWSNIPGFEVWRFFNLILFFALLYFFFLSTISVLMNARRESIRRDLLRAQEERDAAVAKLEEVNKRLARLDDEVEAIRIQARKEAAQEREAIARSTEEETRKIHEQAEREIETAGKVA